MSKNNHILICGAGIAGLSLARRFEQLNIPYQIIEKKSSISTAGAGIALPANAIAALRYLGLGETIEKKAHQVDNIVYASESGKVLSQASLHTPPLNTDKFMAIHRHSLHAILHDGLEKKIQLNSTISDLKQIDDGVLVELNHNGKYQLYAAVVAADGIHSSVRDIVLGGTKLTDLGVSNWRWTSKFSTKNLQPTYQLGAKDAFMVYPIADDTVYCYAHILDQNHQYDTHQQDHRKTILTLFRHYQGISKTLLEQLPNSEEIIPGRLQSVPRAQFCYERVAFVGDASNACSPMLQQGAAAALEDTIVLAEMLKHLPVAQALQHYQQFREDRVNWIINASDKPIKSIAKMQSTLALFIRNLLIRTQGPLNVKGWKQLLRHNPLTELEAYINKAKA